MPDKIRVLFLCTTNAAASQMAEAILTSLAGDRFEAKSAGLTPVPVHPMAEEAMRHINLDLSGVKSKSVTDFANVPFDFVITIGDASENWPEIAGAELLHWDIADPLLVGGHMEDIMQAFMVARHDVHQHVRSLVTAICPKTSNAKP
jgi:protein-tyrosine-phosphatase